MTSATPLAGLSTVLRFMLRRDRVRLPAWAGGMGLFTLYVATAIPAAYSLEDLADVSGMFADPAGRMLVGPAHGLETPTYEQMVANGYGLYLILLAALMSILTVARHTRAEEQTGRAELVRANVVGRHTPLTAALVVTLLTNLACATAIVVVALGVGGYAVTGSLLLGASVAAVGLAFAGVASVTVQLSEYSRAAAGMAGGVLGAAFVLRAGGDMARQGGNLLSWLSPLGWGQQTAPFVLDRWWPLLLTLALAAVTTVAGYALAHRRDLGASLVTVRPGHPRAHPSLGSALGLSWRLQRAAIIGWTASLAASGLVFGGFADTMLGALEDMPEVFRELFGDDDLLAGYLGYMAMFMSLLTSVYAVLAVQGLRNEETGGRAEALLSTPISRRRWLGTNLAVIAGGVVVITTATGVATGTGAAVVTGDAAHLWQLTAAHVGFVPAVLVVLGIAATLFGLVPSAVGATWALLAYGMLVGSFGALLDLPQVAFDLSPFQHLPQMPREDFALAPVLALGAVAAATVAAGLATFHRRDLDMT
jgi:ABC-2 type transport system permease protein